MRMRVTVMDVVAVGAVAFLIVLLAVHMIAAVECTSGVYKCDVGDPSYVRRLHGTWTCACISGEAVKP